MIATYPNLPLGETEADEYKMLKFCVPWLLPTSAHIRPRQMLYVGANQIRPPYHAQRLKQHGWRLHLLEIFAGNIKHHRQTGLFESMTRGDVRHDPLPAGPFDCVFWWHGPEHIPQADVAATLARLEQVGSPLGAAVVLGCPHGHTEQGSVYGNAAERHQWDAEPDDLRAFGYIVMPYATRGRNHLLAWKGQA